MIRRFTTIFISAFFLNLIWEHFHSVLYVSYQGGAITNLVLLRASLFDAVVITIFSYLFVLWRLNFYSSCRSLTSTTAVVTFLTLFAILLEKYALATGRWVYADAMPIIPLLNIGLTPAVQLCVLGYISLKGTDWFRG